MDVGGFFRRSRLDVFTQSGAYGFSVTASVALTAASPTAPPGDLDAAQRFTREPWGAAMSLSIRTN